MSSSSSFFLKKEPRGNKKRKQPGPSVRGGNKKKFVKKEGPPAAKKKVQREEEEIESEDEESGIEGEVGAANLVFSSDEEKEETAQDKRLRLAKEYLEEIEKQEAERAEEKELHDHVSHRLRTEYLDSVGKLRKHIAESIIGYDAENMVVLKHSYQHSPLNCVVLSPDEQYIFTGAKCQYLLKWNIKTLKVEKAVDVASYAENPETTKKRRSSIIAICLSSDMKYMALAEGGNNIQIWCPQEMKHLKTLKGHRDVVTSLVFRKDTHELYSGSKDRSVKIWSCDEMAYVESLFGHQAGITGIDALSRERAISSGGSDCSVRIWKITEESQLIYNGPQGSVENVKFLNDENFISSGTDGSLCLWSALKKKPLCKQVCIHGLQNNGTANWITAISCVVNTDLIASGSCDGFIRLWQSIDNAKKLKPLFEIPMSGFINSLAFNSDGSKLFAAVGQEHRLGRWWKLKEAKNKIVIIDLLKDSSKHES